MLYIIEEKILAKRFLCLLHYNCYTLAKKQSSISLISAPSATGQLGLDLPSEEVILFSRLIYSIS